DWGTILPAYSRCVRITRTLEEQFKVDPDKLFEPAAKVLFAALEEAESAARAPGSVNDYLTTFLPMIPTIDRFFEEVLVMDEDPVKRRNLLGLLQRIASLANGVADMSKLEGF
ncbi:MAG: hypothetical protein ACK2U1_07745, partial [Anaerolineales bacterium]